MGSETFVGNSAFEMIDAFACFFGICFMFVLVLSSSVGCISFRQGNLLVTFDLCTVLFKRVEITFPTSNHSSIFGILRRICSKSESRKWEVSEDGDGCKVQKCLSR